MATLYQGRILVVDDCAAWRDQLRLLLKTRPEWDIIGEACDGQEAIEKAAEMRPDIILLDVGMPILNGIEAAKSIRQGSPGAKIIFLTQENDADIRLAALATGAEAYLLKTHGASELLRAIEAAAPNGHASRTIPCD